MSATRVPPLVRGVVAMLAFAVLSGAVDVYAGSQLQSLGPLALAAISFSLTAALFLGWEVARRGGRAALRPLATRPRDVIAINASTAVTWLSLLYALKYMEPAVVNVVGLAVGPAFTVLLGPLLRRGSSVLAAEVAASLGIFALIGVLAWGSMTGRTGIGALGAGPALLGMALTLVCGLGSTVSVLYSKRLSDAGQSPQSVLAIRFFLIVVVSWSFAAAGDGLGGLAPALLPAAIIAAIGVALPMYLIQVGIKHTEPITASLLVNLAPLFAFLLQLPDRRLHPSALTLAGILGITALVAVGVVARGRSAAPPRPLAGEGVVT